MTHTSPSAQIQERKTYCGEPNPPAERSEDSSDRRKKKGSITQEEKREKERITLLRYYAKREGVCERETEKWFKDFYGSNRTTVRRQNQKIG